MTTPETRWPRENRELPCPKCGRTNWCLVAADIPAARTESSKQCVDACYLHWLIDPSGHRTRRRSVIRMREPGRVVIHRDNYEAGGVLRMPSHFWSFTAAISALSRRWPTSRTCGSGLPPVFPGAILNRSSAPRARATACS